MIILDSDVLIALLDASDPRHATARALLDAHAGERYAASVITAAEVLVHPARAGRAEQALEALRGIGLELVPLNEDSVLGLAEVQAHHRLAPAVAAILQTARRTRSRVVSFDPELIRACSAAQVAVIDVTRFEQLDRTAAYPVLDAVPVAADPVAAEGRGPWDR